MSLWGNLPEGLRVFCRAYKATTPDVAIRSACSDLLDSCGIREAPVPLKPLMSKLGVYLGKTAVPFHQRNKGAFLVAASDAFKILIHERSNARTWRRIRFSIAHELGHVILIRALKDPLLIASLDATPEGHKQLELVCNAAAEEILLPVNLARKLLLNTELGPQGLLSLYDQFLVSKEVLLRRFASLLHHGAVIRWRKHARVPSEEEALRVVKCYPGYTGLKQGRPWLPEGSTAKRLDPPIVEWAMRSESPIFEEVVRVKLGDRVSECYGLATYFAKRSVDQQPSFEGFSVPDEAELANKAEIILFIMLRSMAGREIQKWRISAGSL